MRVDGNLAIAMASNVSYLALKKLNGKVLSKSLEDDDTGVRFLEENAYREMDLDEIIQALELSQNKYMILRLLPHSALMEILALLDKEALVNAMSLFSKEQLMRLLTFLPKRIRIQMLLEVMTLEYLLQMMPRQEFMEMLRAKQVTEKKLIRAFEWAWAMDPKYLRMLFTKMTGQDTSQMKPEEILDALQQFKKREMLDAMRVLPQKALLPVLMFLIQEDPELLLMVSDQFYFKQFANLAKPTLLEGFRILPEEVLIEFLGQLPDPLLAMAASQIDDSLFEAYLRSQQTQLLYMLGDTQAA